MDVNLSPETMGHAIEIPTSMQKSLTKIKAILSQ